MFMRDSLVERDTDLLDAAKPVCTEEEVEGYIWDPKFKKGEQPLKQGDHGCDAARYLVAYVDDVAHNHLLGLNQWMAGETAVQNAAVIELMKEQPKKLESVNLSKPTTSDKTLACPNCENIRVARLPNGQGYRCNNCGTQFGGKVVAPPTQNRHDYLRK
jgi:ribosomal protein L37AE/L43A